MKKIWKLLVVFICIFLSVTFVFAEEDEGTTVTTDDNAPNTESEFEKQKQAITNYCTEGSKLTGCLYDKNDEMYTVHKTGKNGKTGGFLPFYSTDSRPYSGSITMPDLKVLRAYQTFDGDGKAVYAACYRYDYTGYSEKEHTGLGNGSYFFFDFIYENKNGTCTKTSYMIPSEGTMAYTYKREYWIFGSLIHDQSYEYSGKEDVEGYRPLTFNNWTAQDKGDCPKVFGYTANTKWYTSTSNKYIFSENVEDFNVETYAFFSGEKYAARPGCTVDDEAGEEVNRELLLSEIKQEINNYSCPDKISDMYLLSNELTGYYETLRNDENNKYRVLWSHDLAQEVIEDSEDQINKYINAKLTACQYQICEVYSADQIKIRQNLGEDCKIGCSLHNYVKPSQDANAQCYLCSGIQSETYEWMVEDSIRQCTLKEDIPMGLCIGTAKDLECRNCLIEAYEKAGLDETKSKCLIDSEILKNITEADLQSANNQAAGEALTIEMEENEKIRDEIFANLIKQPDLDIYDGNLSCAELLGSGLTKVLNFAIDTVRIIGVIAAIVMAMVTLIPAVNKGDQGELNRAIKKCIWIAVVLVIVVLFPLLVRVIGNLFEFDTSCIY